VIGLTPFYALKEAGVRINEFFLIFGASGNTGMIVTQLGKQIGAKVIAVLKAKIIPYILKMFDV
jgi:NADPH:quinone reductase-like Zn-dependent oxidoreductase